MYYKFLKILLIWAALGSLQFLGAQTAHSVTLTWAPNASGATVSTYNLLRGTVSGAESATPIGMVTASACITSCSYVDSAGLVEGQMYWYEITATVPMERAGRLQRWRP